MHQRELVRCMIDGVDDIVILGKAKFFDIAAGDEIVNGSAGALRIDGKDALAQCLNLAAAKIIGGGMQLTVGVADMDVIVIDQGDPANAAAHAGFRGPGANAANANDAKMGLLQPG